MATLIDTSVLGRLANRADAGDRGGRAGEPMNRRPRIVPGRAALGLSLQLRDLTGRGIQISPPDRVLARDAPLGIYPGGRSPRALHPRSLRCLPQSSKSRASPSRPARSTGSFRRGSTQVRWVRLFLATLEGEWVRLCPATRPTGWVRLFPSATPDTAGAIWPPPPLWRRRWLRSAREDRRPIASIDSGGGAMRPPTPTLPHKVGGGQTRGGTTICGDSSVRPRRERDRLGSSFPKDSAGRLGSSFPAVVPSARRGIGFVFSAIDRRPSNPPSLPSGGGRGGLWWDGRVVPTSAHLGPVRGI